MIRRLLDRIVRQLELPAERDARARTLLDSEWLVTNGFGGYASSTTACVITRRYHGILVAALPNPIGRVVMLNHLSERITVDDRSSLLTVEEWVAGPLDPDVASRVASFRMDAGLPIWEYEWEGVRLEKCILMPHRQNTVHVTYRLIDGPDIRLDLLPTVHFRGYEEPVNSPRNAPGAVDYVVSTSGAIHQLAIAGDDTLPPLCLKIASGDGTTPSYQFIAEGHRTSEYLFPVEESRGYEFRGTLWLPGQFQMRLSRGDSVTLIASVEPEDVMLALSPDAARAFELERRRRLIDAAQPQAQDQVGAELVLAADQFIITPKGRVLDSTRAAALGNEICTVIAGYHWFTDWGRDTMVSLEGLTLVTGRTREAAYILRTFSHYVKCGLIPNMFPDGSNEGLYHTADATLWYFHAVQAYLRRTGDVVTLLHLLPTMLEIVDYHVRGTKFGIRADPADGLLRQGAAGYQLTWMDAKVDGWVVTPRRGKAVELNALWYNALRLLEGWIVTLRGEEEAVAVRARADRVYESFNKRFWIPERGYLYDVVDGDDDGESALCRPNQLLAISLDHPVLERERWPSVLRVVQDRLLTPVGLRSLAPGEPNYKSRYFGDLRSRDAAYHQGTVWTWLIGAWIDAWLKLTPEDRAGARRFLDGCIAALDEFGIGTIAEVFDAEPPFTPRGCIAQAWSVAEVLRCWVRTAPDPQPPTESRS